MKGKKILALSLAVLLLTALLPTAAFAAGSPGLTQGTSVLSEGANTSGAATVYYGEKPWRVIAYDSGSITLLAAEHFGYTKYDSSGNGSNAYGTSTLKTAIEAIAAGFSSGEQSAVIPRTLKGGSANYVESEYHDDHISGDPVENALLWPLSVAEANSLDNELRKADPANPGGSSYWWLRSPGSSDDNAACVSGDGAVRYYGFNVNQVELGVRPAFYVNPESVLFTSAAAGGKSTGAVGAGALTAVSAVDTAAWTLTLLDPIHSGFGIDPCAVTYNSETNAVTVPYSGAMTGYNEFISAIIKDSSGNITYYGRVAQLGTTAAASGSITVNLAGKLNAGDTLFIFNEQVNSPEFAPPETVIPVGAPDTQTDYASALIEIEIPPKGHSWEWVTDKEPTCGEAGSKHEECSVCGAKQNEGTEIPAADHAYGEPEWKWSEDFSTATATFTCANSDKHTYEVTASIEKGTIKTDDTIVAQKHKDVEKPYTATVEGPDGKTYEDTATEILKATHKVHKDKKSKDGKSMAIDVETDTLKAVVTGGVSATAPALVASYDENGRFLGLEVVTKAAEVVEPAENAESIKILWIDSNGYKPQSEAETFERQ